MRDLTRAILRFAAEVAIYTAQHIIEHLEAERPNMDEPLLPGHSFPPDDTSFTGFRFGDDIKPLIDQNRDDIGEMAKQTRVPNWFVDE